MAVTLPPVLSPDFARLGITCAPELALSRGCPENTKVGSVEAATPLLAKPLTGSVYLTANPAPGGLPKLTIQLDDPIPLRLDGTPALTPQGIRTTFTGLPDVPLSRFQLDLDGLFQLGADLCTSAPPVVDRRVRRPVRRAGLRQHADAGHGLHARTDGQGPDRPPQVRPAADEAEGRRGRGRARADARGREPAVRAEGQAQAARHHQRGDRAAHARAAICGSRCPRARARSRPSCARAR